MASLCRSILQCCLSTRPMQHDCDMQIPKQEKTRATTLLSIGLSEINDISAAKAAAIVASHFSAQADDSLPIPPQRKTRASNSKEEQKTAISKSNTEVLKHKTHACAGQSFGLTSQKYLTTRSCKNNLSTIPELYDHHKLAKVAKDAFDHLPAIHKVNNHCEGFHHLRKHDAIGFVVWPSNALGYKNHYTVYNLDMDKPSRLTAPQFLEYLQDHQKDIFKEEN